MDFCLRKCHFWHTQIFWKLPFSMQFQNLGLGGKIDFRRAGRGWLAGPLPEAGPSSFPAAGSWAPSLAHPAAWSGQSGGATSPPHLLHLTAQHLKVCGVKIIGKGDGHFSSTYGTCCASPLRWRYSPWASDYTSWDPSGISPSFNLYTLK